MLVFAENKLIDDEFVNLKMRSTKLVLPVESTVQICKATETAMKEFNYKSGKNVDILNSVFKNICLDSLFPFSDFESYQELEICIKKQDYICKKNSLEKSGISMRNHWKKNHFKGQ